MISSHSVKDYATQQVLGHVLGPYVNRVYRWVATFYTHMRAFDAEQKFSSWRRKSR